jgi:predicted transcriptional regulator
MNTTELTALGVAAFGDRWRKALAAEIGKSREMIYQYERGKFPIPPQVASNIRAVCGKKIAKRIAQLQATLLRCELA